MRRVSWKMSSIILSQRFLSHILFGAHSSELFPIDQGKLEFFEDILVNKVYDIDGETAFGINYYGGSEIGCRGIERIEKRQERLQGYYERIDEEVDHYLRIQEERELTEQRKNT